MWYDYKTELTEKELFGDLRSEPQYREQAKKIEEEKDFYERRLTTAPFYGSGAGVIAIAIAIMKDPSHEFISLVLPSAWFLVFSLFLMFLAGIFYVGSNQFYADELTVRGNAVQEFCNYRDKLKAAKSNNEKAFSQLKEIASVQINSVNEKIKEANEDEMKGDLCIKLARILAGFAALLFLAAIFSPLIVLSSQYDFKFI